MARSGKRGITYFSMDVDIFSDRKLRRVRHAHGAGAMAVVLRVLCCVYGENGYFAEAGDDLYFDIADELGLDEAYVRGVLKSCVEVDFFDAALFGAHGVLTSRRIQRNYMDATRKRSSAQIDGALCLLGDEIKAEETAFPAEETALEAEASALMDVCGVQNAQSKVNKKEKEIERRGKESISDQTTPARDADSGFALLGAALAGAFAPDTHTRLSPSQPFVKPSVNDVEAYCRERGNRVDARRFVDFYESKGWMVGSSPMRDWKATLRGWEHDARVQPDKRPAYERPTENYDHLAVNFFADSG